MPPTLIFPRHGHRALLMLLCLGVLAACGGSSGDGGGGDNGERDGGMQDGQADAESGDGGQRDGSACSAVCRTGTVCDADTGECVADCTGFSCGLGQACVEGAQRAQCEADCDGVTCDDDEACDDSGSTARCVSRCEGECGEGQRCVGSGDAARCEDLSCAELDCELPTVCEPAEDGQGGNVCADISCASDLECDEGEYCFDDPSVGAYCASDVCTPGEQRCSDDALTVEECLPNGGGFFERVTCLEATCSEDGAHAYCPCTDDWSCPAFTACEVDRCEGTGVAPTCFVSVAPMENVLPGLEFQWGSNADRADDTSSDARGERHPFPQSVQVVSMPVVVNLTDDNGDGEVNELDYPEVVFLSYCGGSYQSNGLLRAIHGGGLDEEGNPIAGLDYFATTGNCDFDFDAASPACHPSDANDWLVWNEDEDGPTDALDATYGNSGCRNDKNPFDSTSTIAVANLDGDAAGYPEIVVIGEQADGDDYVFIFDSTGHYVAHSPESLNGITNNSGSVSIANLDGEGLPEIIAGRYVFTLKVEDGTLVFDKTFEGTGGERGRNGSADIGPIGCTADLDEDGRQEVIVGSAAYDFPDPASCTSPPCAMTARWTADVPGDEGFCAVADVWGADNDSRPHPVSNPLDGKAELLIVRSGDLYVIDTSDGAVIERFAIAGSGGGPPNVDDFDGDSMPEVGTAGSAGYSVIDFQAANPLEGQAPGCPAWSNVLDVDNPLTGTFESDRGPYAAPDPTSVGNGPRVVPTAGDGSPILCSSDADCNPGIDPYAFACNENTGQCVCLHNGWERKTQDGSSEATGSSVFDFNGDGAAEVIYNDECFFRVYNGLDSRLYSRIPSESRTRSEYPVVADLDNDGNAEIVFGVSNESGQCRRFWDDAIRDFGTYFVDASGTPYTTGGFNDGTTQWPAYMQPYDGTYNAGLEVWGEPSDLWVSARRIWNQNAYHVTNVTEAGAIPLREQSSWSPALRSARGFNSYRSNPASRAGIAPDLQVLEVDVGASGGGCDELGSEIEITARIRNDGDLRVGADVRVAFLGSWGGTEAALEDGSGNPLVTTLGSPLRPRSELRVRVTYDSAGKLPAGLPDAVTVVVDPDDLERECDAAGDDDNRASAPVVTPEPAADLTLSLDDVTGTCPDRTLELTVTNGGGLPASGVVIRLYAGDPDAGGAELTSITLPEPLPAGESRTESVTLQVDRDVVLHGTVDPDDTITECGEGNNDASFPERLRCFVLPI